ncbi:hypothetical protein KUCAC02_032259, partial [Chaenocephalus aceratus]
VTAVFLNARHRVSPEGLHRVLAAHPRQQRDQAINLPPSRSHFLPALGRYKTGLFFGTLLSIYLEETAPSNELRAEDSSQRACSQRGIPKVSVLLTPPCLGTDRSVHLSANGPEGSFRKRNGNREKCARRNAHTDPTCPPYRARRKESRSDWQPCVRNAGAI